MAAPPGPPAAPAGASNAVPTWQGEVMARLRRAQRYPDGARARREEGVVLVAFTLDRAGRVLGARLARPGGSPELEAEALALPQRASPLPPPPAELPGETLTITVPVRFSLRWGGGGPPPPGGGGPAPPGGRGGGGAGARGRPPAAAGGAP
ncbi:energy transducer TonB, partial [Roseococcus sp. DSY-14]|uniref:energy transducer TonB n=1 Tax=Roseococcus sp. DSY-14 TaxID=3369650 RepID=UPI00387AE807